jgi:hypothetical protein
MAYRFIVLGRWADRMTVDEIMYKAFLIEYKVIGQVMPEICKEERFIRAIVATSDDRWRRAKLLHPGKIARLIQKTEKLEENF